MCAVSERLMTVSMDSRPSVGYRTRALVDFRPCRFSARNFHMSARVHTGMKLCTVVAALLLGSALYGQTAPTRVYPLTSADEVRPHNATVTPITHAGKRGLRVIVSDSARRAIAQLPLNSQAQLETFALIEGTDFQNGVIEAEIAGEPAVGAAAGARGFVGIALRVQPDFKTYDAFYLRPTNGRATDQERRNHAAQYISHPDWPWDRLRRETPSRYESYVDLEPGVWTKIRIEVRGDTARLFVHGQPQPVVIVNDVKTGSAARGGIALWINPGTVAHFRDVRVQPAP